MSADKWLTRMTKDFGILADDMPDPSESVIKMPSPSLNWAVSNGGITKGKAVLLFGPESGGKSLLMQLMIIQMQKQNPNGIGILFDSEFAFNKTWFKKLGGDLKRLIVRQTNEPEKIFDYISVGGEVHQMLEEGAPIEFFAIDSVKGIRYPKDIKTKSTNMVMGGGGASYLGSALKGVLPIRAQYGITMIMVQQVYEEMDEYKKMRNPWIVPDGRALKHFCDYMLQVEKLETKAGILVDDKKNIHGGEQQVGHKIRVKCKKNRLGAPYRTAELSLSYERGIVDTTSELFDLAKSLGVVYHPISEDSGKINNMMWKFGDYPAIKGEDNMRDFIKGNKDIQNEIFEVCCTADESAVNARNTEKEIVSISLEEIED